MASYLTQRSPSAEAITQLVLETFRFNGILLAAGDRLTKIFGLTSALWQVLGAVSEQPLTIAQIARNMGLTRQSVRRTANILQDRGFVEFLDNPDHRRAKLVCLTGSGQSVLEDVSRAQVAWSKRIAEGFDLMELKLLVQTVQKLSEKIQQVNANEEQQGSDHESVSDDFG